MESFNGKFRDECINQEVLSNGVQARAAVGNAIAPEDAVLGTGTAGITGLKGDILSYTLVYTLIAGGLV